MSSATTPRSWRAALVVICLIGTTLVCATLASEVRRANAALEATTSQTLRDYATSAGRVLATEATRRSTDFRTRLFGPLMGSAVVDGDAPTLDAFARRADSVYSAELYGADPLRGYMRIDARSRTWEAEGALRDSAFAKTVADTIFSRAETHSQLILLNGPGAPAIIARTAVADQSGHPYIYAVTQSRAANFEHAMRDVMETVPLLPPSFAGANWNMDQPVSATNRQFNYSTLGVRIIGADGTLLYASPKWYGGPYRGSFTLQTGRGRFTVETVIRPDLGARLVPAAVRSAGRSLYIGLGLVGCFLLAVSLIAFREEMSHQQSERERSMDQLTTGLRHELNNSLASVMLEAQMLAASEEESTDARYAGAAIAEQAERMRKVLRRLDNVDTLPLVSYLERRSMVNLAEESALPVDPRGKARAG